MTIDSALTTLKHALATVAQFEHAQKHVLNLEAATWEHDIKTVTPTVNRDDRAVHQQNIIDEVFSGYTTTEIMDWALFMDEPGASEALGEVGTALADEELGTEVAQ
jgi:hypothetical protein